MIARMSQGWQLLLADLALILFVTTISSVVSQKQANDAVLVELASAAMPERGEPVAIYRSAPDGPGLAKFLADQPADPRMVLSILARFGPDQTRTQAQDAANSLAKVAEDAGQNVRMIIEPGTENEVIALLAFDADAGMARAAPDVARALQRPSGGNDAAGDDP